MPELRQEPSLLHFSEEGKACLSIHGAKVRSERSHQVLRRWRKSGSCCTGPHTNTPGGNGSQISFCDVDNARVPANKRRSSHRGLTK